MPIALLAVLGVNLIVIVVVRRHGAASRGTQQSGLISRSCSRVIGSG